MPNSVQWFTRLWSALPFGRNGRFSSKSRLSKPAKTSGNNKQYIHLPSLLATLTLKLCSCIFSSWEHGVPLSTLFMTGRRLFNSLRGCHMLKRTEVITAKETHQGSLLVTLARCDGICGGHFLRDYLTESELSDRFQRRKIAKMLWGVSHSIIYCNISLLLHSESSSLSQTWLSNWLTQ